MNPLADRFVLGSERQQECFGVVFARLLSQKPLRISRSPRIVGWVSAPWRVTHHGPRKRHARRWVSQALNPPYERTFLDWPISTENQQMPSFRIVAIRPPSKHSQHPAVPRQPQPRPTNGILVAITVMNSTLASSG